MKRIFLVAALLSSVSVFAQTATSGQTQTQQATAESGASSNAQQINFNSPGKTEVTGTQTIKNVPSMGSAQLITSAETCMGSSAGGLAGPGFGVNVGSTWTDSTCKLLKKAGFLWNIGMKAAALALLCTDSEMHDAMEITDHKCPVKETKTVKQEFTDPIIRKRLGLD